MNIDDFAPSLSYCFSNGLDPEYAVIGRVARRIWAKAIKHKYGGNERSQKLKYHIQTSGRSLHAQEISFNDIRTTLQALYAVYDNCNSLHTNADDEAITTPTEESVRRAMAIQLIINKELGLTNNENPLQGSFVVQELTDLVEEAVYAEFHRLSERGGVLGAMESMYQRGNPGRIDPLRDPEIHRRAADRRRQHLSREGRLADPAHRGSDALDEKQVQIDALKACHARNADRAAAALADRAVRGQRLRLPDGSRQPAPSARSAPPSTKSVGSTAATCESGLRAWCERRMAAMLRMMRAVSTS